MKRILALILTLMVALGMVGCEGNEKGSEPIATPAATTRPTELPTPLATPAAKIEFFSQCAKLPKPDSILDCVDYEFTSQGVIFYSFNVESQKTADAQYQYYLDTICSDYGFSTRPSYEAGIKILEYGSTQIGTIGVTNTNGKFYLAFYFN